MPCNITSDAECPVHPHYKMTTKMTIKWQIPSNYSVYWRNIRTLLVKAAK